MKQRQQITATIYDKKGRVVSIGENSYHKTHPYQKQMAERAGQPLRVFLHSEIKAIIAARGRGHRIHIERYDKRGNPKLAAPCPVCQLAIREAGLRLVSYTVG